MKFNFDCVINNPDNVSEKLADIQMSFDATPGEYITMLQTSRATVKDLLEMVKENLPGVLESLKGELVPKPVSDLKTPAQHAADFLVAKFPGLNSAVAYQLALKHKIGYSVPITSVEPSDFQNKINDIKAIRVTFGIGLKESKDLMDEVYALAAPKPMPPVTPVAATPKFDRQRLYDALMANTHLLSMTASGITSDLIQHCIDTESMIKRLTTEHFFAEYIARKVITEAYPAKLDVKKLRTVLISDTPLGYATIDRICTACENAGITKWEQLRDKLVTENMSYPSANKVADKVLPETAPVF